MKANELRIGNYVDLYGNIAQIQRADFSHKEHGIAIDSGKPIPLTEQWLNDFGFEKPDNEWVISHKKHRIDLAFYQTISGVYKDRYCIFYDGEPIEIKYVHQLQNLYFALTGEELKLNQTL